METLTATYFVVVVDGSRVVNSPVSSRCGGGSLHDDIRTEPTAVSASLYSDDNASFLAAPLAAACPSTVRHATRRLF